jgi:hypothetical protein
MRPLARILAPVLAAATLALAGGSTALAASEAAAQPFTMDLHAEWCFDDSPGYLYCFEVEGKALFLDTRAGSSVTITSRDHTVASKDGAVVGESTVVSLTRGVYRADGTVVTQDVTVTRADWLGEQCHYQAVYRIADYELVIDHVNSSCGG